MAAFLIALGVSAGIRAQESAVGLTVEQVQVGIGGYFKVGEWTSLRISVRSETGRSVKLSVEAPDPDDQLIRFQSPPAELKGGETRTLETCFQTARATGDVIVRLDDGDGKLLVQRKVRRSEQDDAEIRPGLKLDVPLWVTLGHPPGIEAEVAGMTGRAARVVPLESAADFPRDWRAWSSVDALVIATAGTGDRPSVLAGFDSARSETLRNWVRNGGHLILSMAAEADAYRKSPLAEWVPATIDGQGTLRQLIGLETYSGQNAPLKISGAVKAARIAPLPQKNVLVKELTGPLLAEMSYGLGRVTIVALDLNRPPLAEWKALPVVCRKLLGEQVESASRARPQSSNRQLSHIGVTDLGTQWQAIQEDFAAVKRPSYWSVMGLILLYVAVIGPLDYLVVNRWLRRPEWTWVTFPLLVCLGAGAAAWGAGQINHAGLQVNQFGLLDIETQTRTLRGHAWMSLYSPETRRYEVRVEPDAALLGIKERSRPDDAVRLTWLGAPENAVGGLYRGASAGVSGRNYRLAESGSEIENLPVPQWSTKSLVADWGASLSEDLATSQLTSSGVGQVSGTIAHHLPVPMEDCLLVVGGWAYFPVNERGMLAPHVEWQPAGPQGRQRDLKALMTGEKRTRSQKNKTESEILTTTEPYNPLRHNWEELVSMVSFHRVAGGTQYTGLGHAALRSLELTPQMQLGRAILIGRVNLPAANVVIDDEVVKPFRRETFVRFVLPVKQLDQLPSKTIPKAGSSEENKGK